MIVEQRRSAKKFVERLCYLNEHATYATVRSVKLPVRIYPEELRPSSHEGSQGKVEHGTKTFSGGWQWNGGDGLPG